MFLPACTEIAGKFSLACTQIAGMFLLCKTAVGSDGMERLRTMVVVCCRCTYRHSHFQVGVAGAVQASLSGTIRPNSAIWLSVALRPSEP